METTVGQTFQTQRSQWRTEGSISNSCWVYKAGTGFTIDFTIINKGVKSSKEGLVESRTTVQSVQTVNNKPDHQSPKPKEVGIDSKIPGEEARKVS